jgi:release factor glutamine methyltransferase
MNIKESLILAASKLQKIGIISANLEARILMQHATGKSSEYLLARFEEKLSNQQQVIFKQLVDRRILLEPIAYIIGHKEFYGYEFIVDNNVLIARQDTEIVVEAILHEYKMNQELTILELGTGSGCIAISLLLAMPNAQAVATDISDEAINVAQQNIIKHQVTNRCKLINSDWFRDLTIQQFDIIVSNPPYIAESDTANMASETLKYEPHLALFAGDDGLASYYFITQGARKFLKPQGKLFVEIGFSQAEAVKEIFINNGYKVTKIYQDLAGHNRVISVIL